MTSTEAGLLSSEATRLQTRSRAGYWVAGALGTTALGGLVGGNWLIAVCAVGAVGALLYGWRATRLRRDLDVKTGSAYLLLAKADGWHGDVLQQDDITRIGKAYSRQYMVMSARDLTHAWAWPYAGEGLLRWSGGVDDQVTAFRVLHHVDDQSTPNNVFAYLPWPAAMAWSARLLSSAPGLSLKVAHRSSGARQGLIRASLTEPALDFRPQEASVSEFVGRELPPRRARLKITQVGPSSTSGVVLTGKAATLPVRILLVRMTGGTWSTLTYDTPAGEVLDLTLAAPSKLGLPETCEAELLEWQLLPKEAFHEWTDFPALVRAARDWVAARAVHEGITLLGTLLPQECSVGLGIDIAASDRGWPASIWPIYIADRDLPPCIPDLDLGASSILVRSGVPRCSG